MANYCGLKIDELARYFREDRSTVYNWLQQYKNGDGIDRKVTAMIAKKFGVEKRS